MTLQVGQRVKPGDVLAKVAQPWKLKAELKIAETQAKDIAAGAESGDRYAERNHPGTRHPDRSEHCETERAQ